jgi:hypothetical protein
MEILSPYVFCSQKGRFLHNLAKAWCLALESPGIEDFRFHDLRHTFASRLAMAGVDPYTVQRAGGWKTAIMVQRYAHLSPDYMRAAGEQLAKRESQSATSVLEEVNLLRMSVHDQLGSPRRMKMRPCMAILPRAARQ